MESERGNNQSGRQGCEERRRRVRVRVGTRPMDGNRCQPPWARARDEGVGVFRTVIRTESRSKTAPPQARKCTPICLR
jgi:hypothetical protein